MRQKITAGPRVPELVARLDSQELCCRANQRPIPPEIDQRAPTCETAFLRNTAESQ
jgi:hypothetical protein